MKIRDVQTLALLSCVLSKQQLPNSLALSPVKAKKGYTIGSNNYPEVSYVSTHQALVSRERVAEWLRRLTRKPKVRTAVGSNPTLDSLVAVRNTSPGRPEPCEGNLVAVAGSCGELMVKHPWPLLEISLSDFRGLATLNINTYLPT